MDRLLRFLYTYRVFFTFFVLELLCAWMIVTNNQYQSTRYFNTSNRWAANLAGFSHNVREYFSLRAINEELANENAMLRDKLERESQRLFVLQSGSRDSSALQRYSYIGAKVINNSTQRYKNFITINRGRLDSIAPGMAVVSKDGAVGKVKSVSDHYAVLISLLNIDDNVSATITRTGHFGTAQWDGLDPRYISLKYIPRHVKPLVGDTIRTSGFNAVFPEGVLIGVVRDVTLPEQAPFHDIKVELAQDFDRLAYVSVVRSHLRQEKDSLEKITTGIAK
ncbi:MAG: rod shape-determining protein MreC [Cyclobacteriaceae bacterium]|jgi:rod shape-determining protein MreC|nr:rod shape-determining protein MreC [Cyclobacteriaceae bacterium]